MCTHQATPHYALEPLTRSVGTELGITNTS